MVTVIVGVQVAVLFPLMADAVTIDCSEARSV